MITVYSKDNCMACRMTKNVLTDLGVHFTEVNINQDNEAFNYLIESNLRTLPVVELDGEVIAMGFHPQNLKKLKK